MSSLERDINLVLSGWNPIGVDGHIALSEYSDYIKLLISALENGFVEECLTSMLSDMGLEFDADDEFQVAEIKNLASLLKVIHGKSDGCQSKGI